MCAAEVDRHVAQRYLIKRRLGKGAYGIVWKAMDRRTGEVVAIKKIFDAFRDQIDAQRTFREIMLLKEFGGHPNIIRLLDVIPAKNDRDIYLVFESMDTDLNAVIQKGRLLKDIHKRCIFYQLLRATKFIHSGRVIHRDQKPANVLLDSACRVKLCDFGLARSLGDLPEGPGGQALTEYVATRWYRAPEVLLSSRWYTPGVDMWSLGCILGEMLRGQPLFPGTSTFHQLELILKTIPLPSMEELQDLGSDYSALILQNLGSRIYTRRKAEVTDRRFRAGGALERRRQAAARRPQQTLDALLPPDTPPEALDLLKRLLAFAPDKRLSAEQALQHPYVQRFHCPDREWARESDVRLPVHEGDQLSAPEYRKRLYQIILEQSGNSRSPREEGLGVVASRAELRASPARTQSLKSGVLPQVPAETPARKRGPKPPRSPGHDPEHVEVRRQSSDPLFQLPPPGRGERPPGATGQPPSAPSGVKTQVRAMAPSLTSQAEAQAANQALIRSDPARGGGPRAVGARRVPSRLPREAPEPRPGRRMFGISVSQGAQGAARAALGGYSQAYGTVCRSALGRLPLLPGPRA
ncbi:mitogen-activated protein kinase 15 isoform X2 [Mus musculus]|uniref:mitogen-activated protein kinase 15 isoform X2 n=1 Tax=Mus musculus TaxID=10090 RepID=UPI0003D73D1B|nr:mitogen-activated protein kinase 15 isoform X2 [Mus musculus]|eukprot:XP_006521163.1 PREDICTED: mitogen-activated protein kinase 15 isoform X2 [Mus musculus]